MSDMIDMHQSMNATNLECNVGLVTKVVEPITIITNITQMMEALAVGWVDGAHDNRALIALEDPYNQRYRGHQFIQMSKNRYNFDRMSDGDIPVDSGYCRLRGFIKFEARDQFRGLFDVDGADDQVWWRARLTARGAELARAGVMLDFESLRNIPFFNPSMNIIESEKALTMNPRLISRGDVEDANYLSHKNRKERS